MILTLPAPMPPGLFALSTSELFPMKTEPLMLMSFLDWIVTLCAKRLAAVPTLPVGVMVTLLPTSSTVPTLTLPVVTSDLMSILPSNLAESASPSCSVPAVMFCPPAGSRLSALGVVVPVSSTIE